MTELIGGARAGVRQDLAVVDRLRATSFRPPRSLRTPVVVVCHAGVLVAAALVSGSASLRVIGFALLVLVLHHRPAARRSALAAPEASPSLHSVTLPLAVAASAAAGGVLSPGELRTVLGLAVLGAAVVTVESWLRRTSRRKVRVVLVGSPTDIMTMSARWAGDRRLQIVGGLAVGEGPHVPRPRTVDSDVLVQRGHERDRLLDMRPDVVVVVPGDRWDPEVVRRLGWDLEGTGIELVVASRLEGVATHRLEHESVGGVHLMRVRPSSPARWVRAVKSSADRVLGLTLLLASAPLLVVLVLAIRAGSPGPGLFTQVRVGKDGRHFRILKLRTMVASAEEEKDALRGQDDGNGLLFKKREDPRVTGLGRVLRKYSLDELPQLVNVVRGDMSLVGPRPALPEEVAQYSEFERRRLVVRPGMTGAWQVGGRSTLGREESFRLDVEYADNYRLVDDVRIGLRTVDAVVRPKGAW